MSLKINVIARQEFEPAYYEPLTEHADTDKEW